MLLYLHSLSSYFYNSKIISCALRSKCMTHFVSILSETIVENNVAFKCSSWKKEASVDALHTSAYNITV